MSGTGSQNPHLVVEQVSARVDTARLTLACALRNRGGATIYLLHLSMYGGEPELYVRHLGDGAAEISFGLNPVLASDLPPEMTVTWLARSAGEPIAPGTTLHLEETLPVPLREPDLLLAWQGRPAPIAEAVSRLNLVFHYAEAPAKPPLRAPRRGFDLEGADPLEIVEPVELSHAQERS